jgi:tetratricopeptide (TPR) repeat protein
MKRRQVLIIVFFLLPLSFTLPASAQSKNSRKPELIIDTGVAEGEDSGGMPAPKERDPKLAKKDIDAGDYYLKSKNYAAAIQRYLEALEYQPDSIPAIEALAKAYKKNGQIAKAIAAYKSFIDKNPDLPSTDKCRIKLTELEKTPN